MKISTDITEQGGLISTSKGFECPKCKQKCEFDIMHYIDAVAADKRALALLFDRRYYTLTCPQCHSSMDADWFPVIVDVSDIGLLIYSTPGIDDGGIDSGFRHYLSPMLDWMEAKMRERICSTPYTAVYGAQGLGTLMDELGILPIDDASVIMPTPGVNWRPKPFWQDASNVPPVFTVPTGAPTWAPDLAVKVGEAEETSIRILHSASEQTSVETLDGYSYGSLFFYFPEHRHIDSIVHACLKVLTGASDRSEKQTVYHAIASTSLSEQDHPWILSELARLAIEVEPSLAEKFLDRADAAEHTWLAVTRSFLDATPRRREDGEEIAPDKSARELCEEGRSIMGRRHTVCRLTPCVGDHGVCWFPYTEAVSAHSKYSAETVGRIFGEVLGAIERLMFVETLRCARVEAFWWHQAAQNAIELLDVPEFRSEFWPSYFQRAWNARIEKPFCDTSKIAAELQSRIDSHGAAESCRLWGEAIEFLHTH